MRRQELVEVEKRVDPVEQVEMVVQQELQEQAQALAPPLVQPLSLQLPLVLLLHQPLPLL